MGIKGLLKAMAPVGVERHVSFYKGKTIAVDASCWLHRAAIGCCYELVTGRPTDKYVKYCMRFVRLLQHYSITVIVVFDGASLPLKKVENNRRRKIRKEASERALKLLGQGKRREADSWLKRAVHVTSTMRRRLAAALKDSDVKTIVAPYEADAQLAYLCHKGDADLCISEDSDLLAYNCNTLTKLDVNTGYGIEFNLNKWRKLKEVESRVASSSSEVKTQKSRKGRARKNFLPTIRSFSPNQFLEACILAGCDYVESLPGIGIKNACKLIDQYGSAEKAVEGLRKQKKKDIPSGYLHHIQLAYTAFRRHFVFQFSSRRPMDIEEEYSMEEGDYNEETNNKRRNNKLIKTHSNDNHDNNSEVMNYDKAAKDLRKGAYKSIVRMVPISTSSSSSSCTSNATTTTTTPTTTHLEKDEEQLLVNLDSSSIKKVLGRVLDKEKAFEVAEGIIDPENLTRYEPLAPLFPSKMRRRRHNSDRSSSSSSSSSNGYSSWKGSRHRSQMTGNRKSNSPGRNKSVPGVFRSASSILLQRQQLHQHSDGGGSSSGGGARNNTYNPQQPTQPPPNKQKDRFFFQSPPTTARNGASNWKRASSSPSISSSSPFPSKKRKAKGGLVAIKNSVFARFFARGAAQKMEGGCKKKKNSNSFFPPNPTPNKSNALQNRTHDIHSSRTTTTTTNSSGSCLSASSVIIGSSNFQKQRSKTAPPLSDISDVLRRIDNQTATALKRKEIETHREATSIIMTIDSAAATNSSINGESSCKNSLAVEGVVTSTTTSHSPEAQETSKRKGTVMDCTRKSPPPTLILQHQHHCHVNANSFAGVHVGDTTTGRREGSTMEQHSVKTEKENTLLLSMQQRHGGIHEKTTESADALAMATIVPSSTPKTTTTGTSNCQKKSASLFRSYFLSHGGVANSKNNVWRGKTPFKRQKRKMHDFFSPKEGGRFE